MPADIKNERLILDDSVKQNKKGEAILGKLYGPVAEFIVPTRNGRMYDEETWEKVFNKPLVKEMFENGGILGELNHPEDRIETDLSKVAVCMPEMPSKNSDGSLTASLDILDTPNGRIVYTLARYGYKLGISSRADGEVYEGLDGNNHVDPDTFDLKAFDIVYIPSVKKARLSLAESLGSKTLKQALLEQLNNSSEDDKNVMLESLKQLDINLQDEGNINNYQSLQQSLTEQLMESLKHNRALEKQIIELQEKLSVCNAKETKLNEELSQYKNSTMHLSDIAKETKVLKKKVAELTEELDHKSQALERANSRVATLKADVKRSNTQTRMLSESLSTQNTEAEKDREVLTEALSKLQKDNASLLENIEDMKQDAVIKQKQYEASANKAKELVENYKQVARRAVNKYIDSKAIAYGLTSAEIKNRLNENYSFNDIDRVCEELKSYKLNLNKLPFDVSGNTKVRITERYNPTSRLVTGSEDDLVDESLLRLAKLD